MMSDPDEPPDLAGPSPTGRRWLPYLLFALAFLGFVLQGHRWHERRNRADVLTESEYLERQDIHRRFALRGAREGADHWRLWRPEIAEAEAEDRIGRARLFGAGESRMVWDEELGQRILDLGGQGAGPIAVLVDFAQQLDEAGVDLLVLPVPPFAALDPGRAHPAFHSDGRQPRVDRWILEFLEALDQRGVETLDYRALVHGLGVEVGVDDAGVSGSLEIFRRQDPHWTHWGATLAAGALAERVRLYPWADEVLWSQGEATLADRKLWRRALGPTARRLQAADPGLELEPEEIFEHRTRIVGERWSFDDRDSPLLLLGDSFTLREHGLPDALLRELGFRLDRITVPGGVPTAVLEALALRSEPLQGKRLVIWVFTTKALHQPERWRPVTILEPPTGTPPDAAGR